MNRKLSLVILLLVFHMLAFSARAAAQPTVFFTTPDGPSGTIWLATVDGSSAIQLTNGHTPRLSRDGYYLLFERDSAIFGRGNVWIRDMQTGAETKIYDNGDWVIAYDFTSADGAQVVFDYSCDVELMDRTGANRHQFFGGNCYDDAPAVNPVDNRVAYHNSIGGGGIGVINADGSNRHILANTGPADAFPQWSPDGQWLSFVSNGNVYKIRDTGENRTQLTTNSIDGDGFIYFAPWTPNGSEVVSAGTLGGVRGIYRINANGSAAPTKIPLSATNIDLVGSVGLLDFANTADLALTMAPDQSPVVVSNELTFRIVVSNNGPADATGVKVRTTLPAGVPFEAVAFQGNFVQSDDAITLNLASLARGASVPFSLVFTPTNSGVLQLQTSVQADQTDFALTNNSRSSTVTVLAEPKLKGIFYSRAGSPDGTVWFLGVDGSDTQITTGEWPRVSPDGRYMLFHRDSSTYSRANVYLRDLTAGTNNLIYANGDYIVSYDFTPDVSQIVFDYSCDVEFMNLDGSNRHQFFGGNCYDDAPDVNRADGRVLWHNTVGGGAIGMINLDGSNRHAVPNTNPSDVWPNWSPDGQWITFLNGADVYKIRADGTERTNLSRLSANGDTFLARSIWNLDGHWIFAAGNLAGMNGLYAIPSDGSTNFVRLNTSAGAAIDYVGSVTGTMSVAPQFINPAFASGNEFRFSLTTQSGVSYVLQSSPDMQNWNGVSTNTAVGSTLDFTELVQPGRRYYRALLK